VAHKKAGGSTRLGRDSQSKRLGVKIFGGQRATAGAIILRQRGQKFRAGENVGVGVDYTLYSEIEGMVAFAEKKVTKFTGKLEKARFVSVAPVTPVVAKGSKK
jgi:large subunit ribosomal protein L27